MMSRVFPVVMAVLAVFASPTLGSFVELSLDEMTRDLAVAPDGYGQVGQTLLGVVDSAGTTTTSNVEFGSNIAISDDGLRLAVSAYRHDWLSADDSGALNEDGGAVFIYDYDGTSWVYKTHFVGAPLEEMGRWPISLSADGQIIAIRRGTGTRPAEVWNVDSSGTKTKLGSDITCSEHGSMLGLTETFTGTTRIAVACEFHGLEDSGQVRVLDYNTTSAEWEEVGGSPLAVDATGTTDGLFGFDLAWAKDGTRLAVSAPNYLDTLFEQGLVRVYDFDGVSAWTTLGADITGNQVNEKLGFCIGMSNDGETLVIGSPNKDVAGDANRGAVSVYTLNTTDSTWTFEQEIAGTAAGDVFGRGIAVSDDGSLFTASSSGYSSDRGQVRVFQESGGFWSSIASFEGIHTGDLLGFNNMGVAGTPTLSRLAMAAIHAQTNGIVQVFDDGFTPSPSLAPSASPAPTEVAIHTPDMSQFDWDIEAFPDRTEIAFTEDADTSEIILYYNISLRQTKIQAFETDCSTPVPTIVTTLTSQLDQDTVKHGNFSIFVNIQQDNVLGSTIWNDTATGEGLISMCIRLDLLLGDPAETSVHFHETKMFISVGLLQGFEITGIELDRLNATEDFDGANVDYELTAFHCDSNRNPTSAVLTQGSDVYLCVDTTSENIKIADVQELMLYQENEQFNVTPIVAGVADALTQVTVVGKEATIRYQIVSQFFADPDPEDITATGSVLLEFTDDDGRRLLRTTKVAVEYGKERALQDDELTEQDWKITMAAQSSLLDSSGVGSCGNVASLIVVMIGGGVAMLF